MRRTAVVTAFAALSLFAAPAWAQDSANLGPTFVQGAKSRYELVNKAKQEITGPRNMSVNMDTSLILACEVTGVDSTGATVKATIEAIKTTVESAMKDPTTNEMRIVFADSFESAKPAEQDASSQLSPFLRPILGKSFTVKLDAVGANADVSGIEALIPNDPQAAQLIASVIGANGLGTSVVGFYVLKDGMEPVMVGEKWEDTKSSVAPGNGTITITTNSAFEDLSNDVATVRVHGDVKFVVDPTTAQQGVSVSLDESDIDGTIMWSTDADMLKELTSNSLIQMTTTIQSMPGASEVVRLISSTTAKRLD